MDWPADGPARPGPIARKPRRGTLKPAALRSPRLRFIHSLVIVFLAVATPMALAGPPSANSHDSAAQRSGGPAVAITKTADATQVSDGSEIGFTIAVTNPAPATGPQCPCTIFGNAVPPRVDAGDPLPVNLGVAFTADTDGLIEGLRFYKAAANTGTHVGTLWSASGQLLASATFSGESASGWQSVAFSSPVAVTAGSTYVASYLAPNGHYSFTDGAFATSGVDSPPLHAAISDPFPHGNGLYAYDGVAVFPTSTYHAANYWVDVEFVPSASGVTVSDPLPAANGVNWAIDAAHSDTGCSIGGAVPAQALSCSYGTLAAGASRHVHITSGTSAATGTTTLLNVASVTTTDDGSGQATATVSVLAAHIGVTKTADAAEVSAGDTIGFGVVVANSGAGVAHGVTISDGLPTTPGTAWGIDARASTALNCAIASGVLRCGPQDLAPGATATVHVVSATTPASCGTIASMAAAGSSNDSSGTSSASVAVLCPDVAVTQTAVASPIHAGEAASFSIAVANDGVGIARGVTMTDTLPAGFPWVIASQPVRSPCAVAGGVLGCSFGDLAPRTVATVKISAPTAPQDCGTTTNTATVAATNEASAAGGNNSSAAEIVVACAPPSISISKTADRNPGTAGDEIGFVITVHNDGGSTANDVVTRDPLPNGTDVHWSIASPVAGCAIAGDVLTCRRAGLDPGDGFSVHVRSSTTYSTECRTYDSTASVTSTNGGGDTAAASILLNCAVASVSTTADAARVEAGNRIGFTVTLTNTGAARLLNPVLTDSLPGAAADWSLSSPVAGCSIAGGVLTCTRAWLDPGESLQVHLTSPTGPASCATARNTVAAVSANGGKSDAGASVLVEGCPNLTPMVPLGLLTAPALGTLDVASAVLGNHVTQGGTPNDPTLGPAVPAVGSGRAALPVTGVDPRPLGILALLLLLAGGVLRWATRRREA